METVTIIIISAAISALVFCPLSYHAGRDDEAEKQAAKRAAEAHGYFNIADPEDYERYRDFVIQPRRAGKAAYIARQTGVAMPDYFAPKPGSNTHIIKDQHGRN